MNCIAATAAREMTRNEGERDEERIEEDRRPVTRKVREGG